MGDATPCHGLLGIYGGSVRSEDCLYDLRQLLGILL